MQLLREKNNFHLPKIATSWAALEDVEKELEWLIDYALYWNFFSWYFAINFVNLFYRQLSSCVYEYGSISIYELHT